MALQKKKNWIDHPTVLEGEIVKLIPMEEAHLDELEKLAAEKKIWEYLLVDGTEHERFLEYAGEAFREREKGTQYPFVIYHKQQKRLVGSTRFLEIQPGDRKLEIGWTWLHPDVWGTAVNFDCKLLLLSYGFETLNTVRIQLKANEKNLRSRKAIEKIGAKFEGVLRKDKITNKGIRNSAYYSIIDDEWPEAKKNLIQLLRAALEKDINK